MRRPSVDAPVRRFAGGDGRVSSRPMMSTRLPEHDDDGRCRRMRRCRRCKLTDKHQTLAILVALALLAQQTSGVGGELAAASNRKSRRRQSAASADELPPLSTVADDPYESDEVTYSNSTTNRRVSASRHFEFVNPKPGRFDLCYYRIVTGILQCPAYPVTTYNGCVLYGNQFPNVDEGVCRRNVR